MNKAEHSTSPAVRMLLVKTFLKWLIDKCDSHKATYIVFVLPENETCLILNLNLIVVEGRGYHQPPLLHKVKVILLIEFFLSEIYTLLVFLKSEDKINIRLLLEVKDLSSNHLIDDICSPVWLLLSIIEPTHYNQVLHEKYQRVSEKVNFILAQKS